MSSSDDKRYSESDHFSVVNQCHYAARRSSPKAGHMGTPAIRSLRSARNFCRWYNFGAGAFVNLPSCVSGMVARSFAGVWPFQALASDCRRSPRRHFSPDRLPSARNAASSSPRRDQGDDRRRVGRSSHQRRYWRRYAANHGCEHPLCLPRIGCDSMGGSSRAAVCLSPIPERHKRRLVKRRQHGDCRAIDNYCLTPGL